MSFESGAPALFTVDPDGQLIFDASRTREAWGRIEGDLEREACHFLLRDRATGWVQYVLATSPILVADHPRADQARFPDQRTALAALKTLGRPPILDAPERWASFVEQSVK